MKTIRFKNGELADSLAIYSFNQSIFSDYSLPEALWALCSQMKDSTFKVEGVATFLKIETKQAQNLLNHLVSSGICTSNIECISYDEWRTRATKTPPVLVKPKIATPPIHSNNSPKELTAAPPKQGENSQLQSTNNDFNIEEEEVEEVISLQLA